MGIEFLFFLIIGAFAGGFIYGLAGFGASLFALGWWLQVLTPVEAVAAVLVMSLASCIQSILPLWREIIWRPLLRFLLPALIGIPIGLQILTHINSSLLSILVALFLIAYGGFFAMQKHLPTLTRQTPTLDSVIGLLGGVLAAVAGLSGTLPAFLCSMRPWTKIQQLALVKPFNFIVLGLSALMLAYKGGYTESTLKIIGISLPIAIVASFIGMMVFRRLNDQQFRRVLITLMFVSAFILLVRELIFY